MPTAVTSPATHAQLEALAGHEWVYSAEELDALLAEELDVFGAGLVRGVGDLAGTGSDTLRIRHYDGVGAAEVFQPLAETEAMTPTGYSLGNDEVTIARYGLAKEESYQGRILSDPATADKLALEALIPMLPRSWIATVRDLWATTIGTFADTIGDSGLPWTVDHELELIAYFREIEGYSPRRHGLPVAGRGVKQLTQLRNSLRNEPYLQASGNELDGLLGLGGEDGGGFTFYGIRNVGSHGITQSGGDYLGGAYIPGAVAYCTASTLAAPVQDPARSIFLPQYGMVLERRSNDLAAHARIAANAWLGLAKRTASKFPQVKVRSVVG